MGENYLEVPEELKDLGHIDLSTNRLELGTEARKRFQNELWAFMVNASEAEDWSDETRQEIADRVTDNLMDIINGDY